MSLALLSLVVMGQVGTPAEATSGSSSPGRVGAVCAAQTTSRLDSLLNPVTGNDERFFARPNGAPNVVLVVDSSLGTTGWPSELPDGGSNFPAVDGCAAADTDFAEGYDDTVAYKGIVNSVTPSVSFNANWFTAGQVYVLPANGNFGLDLGGGAMALPTQPAGWPQADATAACALAGVPSDCSACLTSRGWYRGTISGVAGQVIGKGNLLNFHPPRYIGIIQVLSQLISEVQNVRFSIMASTAWVSSKKWSGSLAMSVPEPFWPSCNKAYDAAGKFSDSSTVGQRSSVINTINGLTYANFSGDNLTSALLYGAGYLLSNNSTTPTAGAFSGMGWPAVGMGMNAFKENASGMGNQKNWCDACVYTGLILLNGSDVGDPADLGGLTLPSAATTIGGGSATSCTGAKCTSKADEIAAWLYRNDFRGDYGGNQRISTYVVNTFLRDDVSSLMASIAKQGAALYFEGRNTVAIKQAVLSALADIANRGQTFATSAVTSIQTGSLQLTQLVPRMYPQRGLPWSGELYRYAQRNEFIEELDLNGDGDKADVFAVDKDGDVVVETGDGFFMKAYSYADLTPIGGTRDDGGVAALVDGGVGTARPFWEAAERLQSMGWNHRTVWTVVDRSDGRGSFTHEDGYVRVTRNNWTKLGNLMGLEVNNCPGSTTDDGRILEKLNLTQAMAFPLVGMAALPSSSFERWELCVKVVIDYALGRDLGDEDGDSDRDESRPSMMGDIFHSSPVVVEPPPERFICDLGLSNQCGRTLYSESLPGGSTPLDKTTSYTDTDCDNIARNDPYEIYRAKNRARDKLVVVGSNGGMLHVFNNGKVKPASEACSGIAWSAEWDEGTGTEEWAFIPPTLVPKLQDMVTNGHDYFVDGDIMVRDVWVDGSGKGVDGCGGAADGKKQWCEYHTMVVGAEGRGGKHYFGLELIWDNSGTGTNTVSKRAILSPEASSEAKPFRWVFPQPGTETAARFGKTLFTLTPKPPPIGPVLITDSSTHAVSRYGVGTREAWVVMVGGGFSVGVNTGRGVYMVDAYWGLINGREDNLYWSAELDEDASGALNGPLARLSGGVVAPVAMVDYGRNESPQTDGFFDTALVADMVGQVWVARFFDPGVVDNEPGGSVVKTNESLSAWPLQAPWTQRASPGVVNNWFIARSFEMDKGAAVSSGYKNIANVQPFFYLPSAAIEPGTFALRAFIGSGNRYALLEEYSGKCRWDNPMACAKYGCDAIEVFLHSRKSSDEIAGMASSWQTQQMLHTGTGRYDEGSTDYDYCDYNHNHYHAYDINDCPQQTGSDVDYGEVNKSEVECSTLFGDDSTYACARDASHGGRNTGDLTFNINTATADSTGKDRYFGFWAYGGSRVFVADGGTPSPTTFDDDRLTDRGGMSGFGDLVSVTNTECTAAGACTGSVGSGNLGWVYEYSAHGVKTATGSAIVGSCVLWSSLNPGASVVGGTNACATGVATSTFFQGDYITGFPNCAVGFSNPDGGVNLRGLERSVLTPPPEPATIVQISKSGQIRYSAQLPEPGKGQQLQVDVIVGGDLLQSVYTLPVSRSTHDCRHNQGGQCNPVP